MKRVFVASFAHWSDCYHFACYLGYTESFDAIIYLGVPEHPTEISFVTDNGFVRYFISWEYVDNRYVYYVEKEVSI